MKINFTISSPINEKDMNLSIETCGSYFNRSFAVIREGVKVISAGVAIRNPTDKINEKLGRHLAVRRAIKAAWPYNCQYQREVYAAYRKAERKYELEDDLVDLSSWFNNGEEPNIGAIEDAQRLLKRYARRELPDWVEALANGNPDCIASVYEVAREQVKAEGLWPEQ